MLKAWFYPRMSRASSVSRRPAGRRVRPQVEFLEDRRLLSAANPLVIAADAGGGPEVRVFDAATKAEKFDFFAYDAGFTGGVRVAVGDVNGDGVPDIITAPGPGGGPNVKAFSGVDGQLLMNFMAFDVGFTAGVYVAAGDINYDGKSDIIVGAGAGGGPNVRVFSGADGSLLRNFTAFDPSFLGGVTVAAGDVNADGRADLIVGAGAGGGPNVRVFSGFDGSLLMNFMAYDIGFTGGVCVAGGDINGDGWGDVLTGTGAGGGPNVRTFSGRDGTLFNNFMAYDPAFTAGIRVGTCNLDITGAADIVTSPGPGGGPNLRTFDGASGKLVDNFTGLDPAFTGGAFTSGPGVPARDPVIEWNRLILDTLRSDQAPPTRAARYMAILQTAIYDAVNAIDGSHEVYHVPISARAGASEEAAAIAAGNRVLDSLFPSHAARYDAVAAAELAGIPDGQSKLDGLDVGRAVADNILAWRSTDGSNAKVPYTPGTAPGDYQLTPPNFLPALDPQWGSVTPFAMPSVTQFLPPGPPPLDSPQYQADLQRTYQVGGMVSSVRTADQTAFAHFWADIPGTVTPPGHWNEIAEQVSQLRGLNLVQNAHLFALLDVALADASITCWDAKYIADFWRPVTAIQATIDPNWQPLWKTPNFPEYTSGHSTFSGASATILDAIFGSNTAFVTHSDDNSSIIRTFTGFDQAAQEAGESRVYGGIHFEAANHDGIACGQQIASYVLANVMK